MSTRPGVNVNVVNGGDYEDREKGSSSTLLIILNIINTFTHICIGAVVLGAFFYANLLPTSIYSLRIHIYLCVTGYVALMAQAVLALNPHSGWARMFKYQNKKAIHWVTQILGSVLVITGSAIRIMDIDDHLETTHGILAVVALLFVFLSLIGGVLNLFAMQLNINPTFMKLGHSILGVCTVTLGFLTLVFGLDKALYRDAYGDINTNLMISLTVIALFGIILSASFNSKGQLKLVNRM